MIFIDGSMGEGGGAVLRLSVALSAFTNQPLTIVNIRANRPNPGLRAQHLAGIKAVAELSEGKLEGAKVGSKKITFYPGEIEGMEKLKVEVGTAGSITLVLQALIIPLLKIKRETKLVISGGTDVAWSPPIDYFRFVFLPLLKKIGFNVELKLLRRGYYPAGGGRVEVIVTPLHSSLKPLNLTSTFTFSSHIPYISGISHSSFVLSQKHVAERQAKEARKFLFEKTGREAKIEVEYVNTLSPGSGLTLWAVGESGVAVGGSALGKKGKSSEEVGREAAQDLLHTLNNKAIIDRYMADQILPFLAIAGGKITIPEWTGHAKTNLEVLKKFGFELKVKDKFITYHP